MATREREDISEAVSRDWEERSKAMNEVKMKLRLGWRNDDAVLEQYFQGCYNNWKVYKGPRTPNQVIKLQSLYKQSVYGDISSPAPANLKSLDGVKWQAWHRLKGMPQIMAKRRFITYMSEIDPLLIDVMPDEKPPEGFPLDRQGLQICAKCNTKVGCHRDLVDNRKISLKKQLFEDDDLHTPANLREWIKHAFANQRCLWGVHQPISKAQAKPYMAWFDSASNRGFLAYDSSPIMLMVRDLLAYHYDLAYDMQEHRAEYGTKVAKEQITKTLKLKTVYEELSGEEFVFEMLCTRYDVEVCNQRRVSDGNRNHKHPVVLVPLYDDDEGLASTYEDAVALRLQCQRLGLQATTGVVADVHQRCEIYRNRISEYFEALQESMAAKQRNEERHKTHKKEKTIVAKLSRDMIARQCWEACHDNAVDKVLTLVRRKCDPNEESPRGLTPLLACVINNPPVEVIEEIIASKADVNRPNQFGLTPLILACRVRDTKLVHVLMRSGAAATQKSGAVVKKANINNNKAADKDSSPPKQRNNSKDNTKIGNNPNKEVSNSVIYSGNLTALHWCAVHGAEEECKVMLEYVRDGGGDSLRLVRFLDAQNDQGETPLMLAAKARNGLMCRALSSLGANPNVLSNKGRNAYTMARSAGWSEVADWLEKKVGSGVARIETYADMQYDQALRYGSIKAREAIQKFGKLYVSLTHQSSSSSSSSESVTVTSVSSAASHFLGSPSKLKMDVKLRGDRALKEQRAFANAHQLYFLHRDAHNNHITIDDANANANTELNSNLTTNTSAEALLQKQRQPALALAAAQDKLGVMRQLVADLVSDMRKGILNPNCESDAKPFSWTPLMCAVLANDIRSIRLMIREGADPNYPNRFGTTAIMLAAQTQSLHALVELLVVTGDISDSRDNEGHNVLSYANSLPLPDNASSSPSQSIGVLGVVLAGDAEGPRRMTAYELLKTAETCGVGKMDSLRETVEDSLKASEPEVVQNHFRFLRLLEQYGLTRMETTRHVQDQYTSAEWRCNADAPSLLLEHKLDDAASVESEDSLVERQRAAFDAHMAQAEREEAERNKMENGMIRCPLCTLWVPCNHFLKADTVRRYHKARREDEARKKKAVGGTGKIPADDDMSGTGTKVVKFLRVEDKRNEVLADALLHDRKTDRSVLFANNYRPRDIALSKEKDAKKKLLGSNEDGEHNAHGQIEEKEEGEREGVGEGEGEEEAFRVDLQSPLLLENGDSRSSSISPPRHHQRSIGGTSTIQQNAAVWIKSTDTPDGSVPSVKFENSHTGEAWAQYFDRRSRKFYFYNLKTGESVWEPPNEDIRRLLDAPDNASVTYSSHDDDSVTVASGVSDGGASASSIKSVLKKKPSNLSTISGMMKKHVKFTIEGEDSVSVPGGGIGEGDNFGDGEVNIGGVSKRVSTPAQGSRGASGTGAGASRTAAPAAVASLTIDTSVGRGITSGSGLSAPASPSPLSISSPHQDHGHNSSGDSNAGNTPTNKSNKGKPNLVESLRKGDDTVRESSTSIGPNPVPGSPARRLYLFTNETIDRRGKLEGMFKATEYLSEIDRPISPSPFPVSSVAQRAVSPMSASKSFSSKRSKKMSTESDIKHRHEAVPNVQISGWLFVGLSSLDSGQPPVETMSIPIAVWGALLEHIRRRFLEEWVRTCELYPLPDSNNLHDERLAIRCTVCAIGYVRTRTRHTDKSDEKSIANNLLLCLPCMIRQEIYDKAKLVIPRTQRRNMKPWPFRRRNAVNDYDDEEKGFIAEREHEMRSDNLDPKRADVIQREMAMLDKSPVVSVELLRLDDKMATVDDLLTNDNDNDDVSSLGGDSAVANGRNDNNSRNSSFRRGRGTSNAALASNDNVSLDGSTNSITQSQSSLSTASSNPAKDGEKFGPREIVLIPFLIAKGHYEDAERTVRAAVGLHGVNEGEGLPLLVQLLTVQAEMYKSMGLWPLAVAVYIDCLEMASKLVGFDDLLSKSIVTKITMTLRRMKCEATAQQFVDQLCERITAGARHSVSENKTAITAGIAEADQRSGDILKQNEAKVTVGLRHMLAKRLNGRKRAAQAKVFAVTGPAGLWALLTSPEGFAVSARIAFFFYCEQRQSQSQTQRLSQRHAVSLSLVTQLAQFLFYVVTRLRMSDHDEITQHLVQQLIQKLLAKTLAPKLEIARLFREVTAEAHIQTLNDFVHYGTRFSTSDTFHSMLLYALERLAPTYKAFYHGYYGTAVRDHGTEAAAEVYFIHAAVIQSLWRAKYARIKLRRKKEQDLVALEKKKQRDAQLAAMMAANASKKK